MHEINMSKLSKSLHFSTNIALIVAWGLASVALMILTPIYPLYVLVPAVILGCVGGYMQVLSFEQAKHSFLTAESMLEVRKALKLTTWGKRYLYFLWGSQVVLVLLALSTSKTPIIAVLVGYFSLMFARELVTLKSTIEINSANNA